MIANIIIMILSAIGAVSTGVLLGVQKVCNPTSTVNYSRCCKGCRTGGNQ